MYIANHFLNVEIVPGIFVPDRLRVEETNSKASIEAETQTCRDVHNGRPPNFILLDFVDKGDWSRVAKPQEGFAEKAGKAFCGLLGKIGINC